MTPRPRGRTAAGIAVVVCLSFFGSCSDEKPAAPPKSGADDAAALRSARNLGKLHFDRDSEEGYIASVKAFGKAVALSKGARDDRLNLARALLAVKDGVEEAGTELAALELEWPDAERPAAVDYLLGLSFKRVDDHETALTHFARAATKRPDHAHAALQKGRVLFLLGKLDDALVAFDAVLKIDPKFRAAAFHRFVVLDRLGRDAAVVAAAKAAYEALPEAGQPDSERCDFTRATRIPVDRRDAEPPEAKLTWRDATKAFVAAKEGASFGAVADADGDGVEEIYATSNDGVERFALAGGAPKAESVRGIGAGVVAIAAGDVDNDGAFDLALGRIRSFQCAFGVGGGEPALFELAIDGIVASVDLFDYDHDGDLDAILGVAPIDGGATTVLVARNNGDRTFAPMTDVFPGVAAGTFGRADAHDVDQGNDLDFVFPSGGGLTAFLNKRVDGFAALPLPSDVVAEGATIVRVEDLDADGAPDLFTAGPKGFVVARNADAFGAPLAFRLRDAKATVVAGGVVDCVFEDVDADGDFDAILATGRGFVVARNRSGGTFALDPEVAIGVGVSRLLTADLDGDGIAEVVVRCDDGSLRVFARTAAPAYAGWTVRPEGRQDNRGAVGTVVEQHAAGLYQSAMIKGPSGLRLGLGRTTRDGIDGLRLRYPQGVIQAVLQDELALDARGTARFKQKEGLVASCPFLYARGPEGMEFLTDVVGIAPLDEWLPPGGAPVLDPEERVRIDGSRLSTHDGLARLVVTEELRETTYLDRVRLDALDHPDDVEVYGDESTRQAAYEPFVVYAARKADLAAPTRVLLPGGVDETAAAATIDGRYVHGYPDAPPQWRGWVPRYEIELEAPIEASALLLTGRIAWYDSTVVFALSQHGRTWGPLRLERVGDGGEVDVLVEDLGVPAGMDRTMVATWSTPVPKGSRLRLSGTHRFLWDRIAFAKSVERIVIADDATRVALADGREIVRHSAPLLSAILGEHGYSKMTGDRARHEQGYLYAAAEPDDAFARATGMSTRFGPVDELLTDHDDRLVTIVAGDKVDMDFRAPATPAAGVARTWFLLISGWAKEGGFHNRTGRTIEPLPFRGMSRYPPPPSEAPSDPAYRDYLDRFQSRPVR